MAGPAVALTQRTLADDGHPILAKFYFDTAAKKMLPRLQAAPGPHKTSNQDPHIGGRALDIVLFSDVSEEREIADDLVEIFLDLRDNIKWIALIYNGSEWNGNGDKFSRKKFVNGKAVNDPGFEHRTHIHIEWSATSVDTTGFGDRLTERLAQCFDPDDLGYPTR